MTILVLSDKRCSTFNCELGVGNATGKQRGKNTAGKKRCAQVDVYWIGGIAEMNKFQTIGLIYV
ncbi:hypothetical protein SAE01_08000 [Segetibacter aerophilus]|uniref:Uncharacterized protein n=1 Tax=Segetibacter aerophilus TaxID=670293 RepID=A0A512B8L3_9BACT|nr:hypothetical protein SAE01_08000 [Segetibacter aerophilus]